MNHEWQVVSGEPTGHDLESLADLTLSQIQSASGKSCPACSKSRVMTNAAYGPHNHQIITIYSVITLQHDQFSMNNICKRYSIALPQGWDKGIFVSS